MAGGVGHVDRAVHGAGTGSLCGQTLCDYAWRRRQDAWWTERGGTPGAMDDWQAALEQFGIEWDGGRVDQEDKTGRNNC